MIQKLKAWRRKYFPTKTEQFQDGDAFANREIKRYGVFIACETLMALPLSKTSAFDRGMINCLKRARSSFEDGYRTADMIIKDAPKNIAIQVIARKKEDTNFAFAEGMQARLLKEEW